MKRSLLLIITILVFGSMVFAQPIPDGILNVPKTEVAPEIDAVVDTAVWNYVAEALCVLQDPSDGTSIDDWWDSFGSLRMMYDDVNLYILLEVHDDFINTEGGDYNYDGVEIYFDADNSKGFGDAGENTYDGMDDIQMRFNVGEFEVEQVDIGYGEGVTGWGFDPASMDYYIEETDVPGWTLEAAIPLESLQLVPGDVFGFDAQINDADESTREHMLRWWQDADNANDAWRDASLFGEARLNPDMVIKDGYLPLPQGSTPTLDAAMAAGEWDDAWPLPVTRYEPGHYSYDHIEDWSESRAQAWVKWGDGKLHYFLRVYDDWWDIAEDVSASAWEFDSIEIFFDGDNSKGLTDDGGEQGYDGLDDIQTRLNLGYDDAESITFGYGTAADWGWDNTSVEYATSETDLGWNVEASYDLGALQIAAEIGVEFGFDMQLNECDDPDEAANRTVSRWWAPSEPTWRNSSLFGTVVLSGPMVGVEEKVETVHNYDLAQNYPNPFNPTTTISYSLAKAGQVELTVFNLLGEQVASLANEVQEAGVHHVTFDASNLTTGVYFYTLRTDGQTFSNKMMLMK